MDERDLDALVANLRRYTGHGDPDAQDYDCQRAADAIAALRARAEQAMPDDAAQACIRALRIVAEMAEESLPEAVFRVVDQALEMVDTPLVRHARGGCQQAEADTARLDWLDRVNAETNARNGTVYGWKFDINHNRAALSDHNLPALSVRAAIDRARSQGEGTTE